jgi:CheY-like chemotaxis protein
MQNNINDVDISDRPINTDKKTILYIDNDRFLLDMWSEQLRNYGYNVFLRDTLPEDFIEEIMKINPNLIVCNFRNFNPTGTEVIEAVRTDSRTKDTPFVFLTNATEYLDTLDVLEITQKFGAYAPISKAETGIFEVENKIADLIEKSAVASK